MLTKKNDVNKLWLELLSGRPYFIAEAGVNHEGDLELAEKLILAAKKSGADAIKFQTYKAEKLTTKNAPRFWDYEKEPIKEGSQFDSYSELDKFGKEEHLKLKNLCDIYDIEFFSTPFDFESIDFLEDIGVNMHKVASCDLTNFPLLEKIAKTNKIIHLSTGASNLDEIKEAVELISKFNEKIVIMHCNLKYPTMDSEANLGMIKDLKENFGKKYVIGLSDHTLNSMTTAFSWLLGATVYERHFTVDKNLEKTPDHSLVCVDENGMRELIINTKKAIEMHGEDKKRTTESEEKARKYARRSVVSNSFIKKGELFTEKNLTCKRPGTGISPKNYYDIIGKIATRNINEDELISTDDYIEYEMLFNKISSESNFLNKKKFWNEINSIYSEHYLTPPSKEFIEILESNLKMDDEIFEYGCSSGMNIKYLKLKGYKKITGADISDVAIKKGIEIHGDLNLKVLDFTKKSPKEEEREKYDVVFIRATLQHISSEYINLVLKRINFILKNNGLLIFSECDREDMPFGRIENHRVYNTYNHNWKKILRLSKFQIIERSKINGTSYIKCKKNESNF